MKNNKKQILKCIFLSFYILTSSTLPFLLNFIDAPHFNFDSVQNSSDKFISSINNKDYLAKYISAEDVEIMKQKLDTQQARTGSDDNLIIDGHGTGYLTPSIEDLDSLIGKTTLLDVIRDENTKFQATADLSSEIYFPVVGDQGYQGSCSAWANAYYAYGYLEAKDHGWDASSGNSDYLLSPAWAYNLVATENNEGSTPYDIAQVLLDWGVPTLSAMPYDDLDVDSWGDEIAWRQAPYHRPYNYTLITYSGPSTITLIKSLIDSGTLVTFGIDASQFNPGLNQVTSDFILSSNEYGTTSLNHAQCFVGYDDAVSEGSDVGAFRVVNSWGDSWMDNGYYWLTYDAFDKFAAVGGQVIMFITDRIDYNPNIIATWEFSDSPTRMDDIVTLGVGPFASPFNTITPLYDEDTDNLFPNFMALDITEFYPNYTHDNDVMFFLEVNPSDTTGTISSFKLERYSGGVLQQVSRESVNVPQDTPGYVNATFEIFLHELRVTLEVPTDPIIHCSYPIKATIFNNGASDENSVPFEILLNGMTISSATIPTILSGTNYSLTYNWTPTSYDIYNFTAQTPPVSGEIHLSNNLETELISILVPVFYDDFESGLSNWASITGLWHLTNDSSIWADPYHSPTHSMWFGNESTGNYETGLREFGNLTSVPIDLSGTSVAQLEFYHWRETETEFGYDLSYVYISIDGVIWDEIYINTEEYTPPWEKVTLDISAYAGNSSVQIRFYFDTIDSLINDYRGWLVDDVMILGDPIIPHDLRVSLEIPENPEIYHSYTINATVTNIGTIDQTDVDFFFYLDGTTIGSVTIPSLVSGASYTLDYYWDFVDYGVYNFTAYAPPLSGEFFTTNNLLTVFLYLHEIILFDGMFLDYSLEMFGETFELNSYYSYLYSTFFQNENTISYGGTLFTMGLWDVDCQTRLMSNSLGGFTFGSETHTPLWIFTDNSIGDIIPIAVDGEGDHLFNITEEFTHELFGFGLVDVWKLEDLTEPGAVAFYDKSTGILLNGTFIYDSGVYNYTLSILDTNAPFEYHVFEHELTVNLETPEPLIEVGNSYLINATVKNIGLHDETNVELLLYLENTIIDSITIPTLTVGSQQTIQYMWTPTECGSYNFTAYAPEVPLESYIPNNMRTTFLNAIDTKLFDDLYITYYYESILTTVSYGYFTDTIFTESFYLGGFGSYSWYVDALTRLMSGGSIFTDDSHSPFWIFTNTSLYDTIPIGVDGEGDHDFNVTREFIYNLPGFGPIEVWELEDLTEPGGLAWYEQSTGILLNGTFFFNGGTVNYTFDFVDTNAEFNIIAPPDNFTLSSDAGEPDLDGIFELAWSESARANNYSIYEYSSYITMINGSLTILADEITDLELVLPSYLNGTYYFIVVAHNNYGDTLSNCLEITVEILPPPGEFTLSSDAGSPDIDGDFVLEWTTSSFALNYSVYRYSSYITEINGSITLLADEITNLNMTLTGYLDGTYYFIVVAHNDYGDTLSNCRKITVAIPEPPGEFTLTTNAGDPDIDGHFALMWTEALNANNYSFYVHSSYINAINGSVSLWAQGLTDFDYWLTDYDNGVHYFIVVAYNNYGRTLSNCIKVWVNKSIPGYDLPLVIAVLGVTILLMLRKRLKTNLK